MSFAFILTVSCPHSHLLTELIHTPSALTQVSLSICQCTPAPTALLNRGYMACAPTHPTLAVDLRLLEFARMQFLHMVPNSTGWCGALEAFLSSLGYKLKLRVSFSLAAYTNVSDSQAFRTVSAADSPAPFAGTTSFAMLLRSGSKVFWMTRVCSYAPANLKTHPAPIRLYLLLPLHSRHPPLHSHHHLLHSHHPPLPLEPRGRDRQPSQQPLAQRRPCHLKTTQDTPLKQALAQVITFNAVAGFVLAETKHIIQTCSKSYPMLRLSVFLISFV